MMRFVMTIVVCYILTVPPTCADDRGDLANKRLPAPLDNVTCEFGALEKAFRVVGKSFYAADEFMVDGRTVAEETIVWTLEAKDAIKGRAVYQLLHPNPSPNPFFRIRFFKIVDGRDVSVDARPQGYYLVRDGRWINPKNSPDLEQGEKLHVWVHLGKEGSAGLIEQKAIKMVVTEK